MDSDNEQGYKPRPDFQAEAKEPLIDLSSTDNTELWLIQWPKSKDKELPGLDGQELSLKLHRDGQLGSFEDSSGKAYDVVSFAAQESNATVFLSSAAESKIGRRREKQVPERDILVYFVSLRQSYQNSRGISLTNSSRQFSTPSSILRKSQSTSRHQRSSLSELGEPSETPKKRHVRESAGSMEHRTQDSGRGNSELTYSGLSDRSHQSKSKKRVKTEED
ncbi:mediator-associated protein 2 [Quercus suber]|uniref:Mediator-associated protein 2 n=1 Tax=Quercus suber TaxID=58331 RepID=A0AAW0LQR9_QUESU